MAIPSASVFIKSRSARGRGRLPTWVVRILSVFCCPFIWSVFGGVGGSACHRLLRIGVDAPDESGGVGVGPVGMPRFEIPAHLFPGIFDRHTLTLERESSRADLGDQVPFRPY